MSSREGGNAVDALLAAAFTAFVTEGPLTGPAGGGLLLVHEPGGETTLLDCFFAVPADRLGEMDEVVIDFEDAGTQVFHVGERIGRRAGTPRRSRRGAPPLRDAAVGATSSSRRSQLAAAAESTATSRACSSTGSSPRSCCATRAGGASTAIPHGSCTDEPARRSSGFATRVPLRSAELLPEYADDLAAYEVVERVPLETEILGRRVLAAPAPSRGGRIVVDDPRAAGAAREPPLR